MKQTAHITRPSIQGYSPCTWLERNTKTQILKAEVNNVTYDSLLCQDISKCGHDNLHHVSTGRASAGLVHDIHNGGHFGSASWRTNSSGIPVQQLQYLPYGEPFVDQRMSGYNERFTFTGKERDEETGYGYFGARYMDHELTTMWLSVDPLADKYPGISPYAYCAWNPVKYIDPDGDSVAILLAGNTLGGEGHMAILVQNEDGEWELWSKNGEGKSSSEAQSASDNDKPYNRTFRNVQDFLDDQKANSEGHNGCAEPYYTEAYLIPTTKEQDKKIREKMATFMCSYHLLSDNCADAVRRSLKAAKIVTEKDLMEGLSKTAKTLAYLSPGFLFVRHLTEDVIPVTVYRNIKEANPDGTVYRPKRRKK